MELFVTGLFVLFVSSRLSPLSLVTELSVVLVQQSTCPELCYSSANVDDYGVRIIVWTRHVGTWRLLFPRDILLVLPFIRPITCSHDSTHNQYKSYPPALLLLSPPPLLRLSQPHGTANLTHNLSTPATTIPTAICSQLQHLPPARLVNCLSFYWLGNRVRGGRRGDRGAVTCILTTSVVARDPDLVRDAVFWGAVSSVIPGKGFEALCVSLYYAVLFYQVLAPFICRICSIFFGPKFDSSFL